ncbi:MAG TPA: NrsF family protein [Candidatus Acidoferrales bacterium]|nr:NrsF family protein [Candidatus Acidoferrales bacterium]
MNDHDMDEILKHGARTQERVSPELLDRIAASVGPSLEPVRPLPPPWAIEVALVAIATAIALAGAAKAGFDGFLGLSVSYRVIIFCGLAVLIFLAASEWVSENIPGRRRRFTAGAAVAVTIAGMLAVFGILFRDYHTTRFLHAGVACLGFGLLHAIPAAFLGWLVLRRGFAVNAVTAGLVGGALAGLAGVTMLELHCPNFQALHILIWHTAVVPVSAAVGALLAWMRDESPIPNRPT